MARAAAIYTPDTMQVETPQPASVAPAAEAQSAPPEPIKQGGESSKEPVVNHSGAVWEPVQEGGR